MHGNEDMVTVIVEYLKEGVGDSLRVTRFLDALSLDGETPLMVAARTRNAIMCHTLTTLGADPNIRNSKGRTAAYLARTANWSEIADWLEKKAGVGMSKMETFSDMQFEKQQRFGLIKVKDLIQQFGREYLHLVQNRIGLHPLGCPFVARSMIIERGLKARAEQKLFVDHHVQYVLQRESEPYTRERQRSVTSNHAADVTADEDSKAPDAEKQRNHLLQMHDAVNQMVALLRKGTANPNAESLDKPLAFTPLMCAVVLSDARSVKLMVREGANPDHPNKDGTTAVMLAAQLQNIEMLMQLLLIRPQDALKYLSSVDNQGNTALAYASSLPLPSIMERDEVDILMSGDVDGPRPLSSAQLISIVLAGGLMDLHDVFENAQQRSSPQAVDTHYKVQHLLEMFGLSRVKSVRHIHETAKSSAMRLNERGPKSISLVDGDHKKEEAAVVTSTPTTTTERPRCPLCTLVIPCQHFFSEDLLKQFMNKKVDLKLAKEIAEDEAFYESQLSADAAKKKSYVSDKRFKAKSRSEAILNEAQIGDRRTDRSLTLINTYRPREQQLMREKSASLQLLVSEDDEEDDDDENIAIAIEDTRTSDSKQLLPPQRRTTASAAEGAKGSHLHRVESFRSASTGISELTAVTFDSALIDKEDYDELDQDGDSMRLLQISEEVKSDAVLALAAEEYRQTSSSSNARLTVPRLKSSLKVLLDVGDVHSASNAVALTNAKIKKRVKFYLPTDSTGETGADSADEMVDDDTNHGATLISDDVSLFSDSTQPMETMKPNSVLITLPFKADDTSPNDGMASDRISGLAEASSAGAEGRALVRAGSFEQQRRSDPAASATPLLTNPIPSHLRKVFMFTKASMDRHGEVDGLIRATKASSSSLKRKAVAGRTMRPVTVQVSGWIFVSLADIKSEVHLLDSIELSLVRE
jgi:ankyrin repeat protein